MNATTKKLPTRGEVQAMLGESLMHLRVASRELERITGVRPKGVWEFIEEADAMRWLL